jgi:hypothetical protein
VLHSHVQVQVLDSRLDAVIRHWRRSERLIVIR